MPEANEMVGDHRFSILMFRGFRGDPSGCAQCAGRSIGRRPSACRTGRARSSRSRSCLAWQAPQAEGIASGCAARRLLP